MDLLRPKKPSSSKKEDELLNQDFDIDKLVHDLRKAIIQN